jgi:ribosomal 50S subunit-associated protein YjgA (DUF615 family)
MATVCKKLLVVALSLAGTLYTGSVVSADYDRRDESRMSTRDQRSFERYLDSNSRVARQLYQDPELIRDRQFVRDHESLDNWLDNHPEAQEALQANPHKYLRDDRASQTSDSQQTAYMSERDLSSFESFLDSNPETAQSLYQNPELINDRQFTRGNTALDNWLDSHPRAADAIQANPHKFLWRERKVGAADFLQQLLK